MTTDLTPREREVAVLIVQGLLRKVVADRLGLTLDAVSGDLKKVFKKLKVNNRVSLTLAMAAQRAPVQRPLTDEQIKAIWWQSEAQPQSHPEKWWKRFAHAIEAAHGIANPPQIKSS